MENFCSLCFSAAVVRRAIAYAVVVGSLLIAINHGDVILRGQLEFIHWVKMGLTVMVPYTVSTLSSVQALRGQMDKTTEKNKSS